MWLYLETESSNGKEVLWMDPNPIRLCPYEERMLEHGHPERDARVTAQGEDSHLEVKGRPMLPAPWSQTVRLQNYGKINFCYLSYSVCGTSLWEPLQTNTMYIIEYSRAIDKKQQDYDVQILRMFSTRCLDKWIYCQSLKAISSIGWRGRTVNENCLDKTVGQ